MADILYKNYFDLHSGCIGTKDSNGLKTSFHIIYDEILEKEKQLNECINFTEVSYYLVIILIYAFISILWSVFLSSWEWSLNFQINLFIYSILTFVVLKLLKIIK